MSESNLVLRYAEIIEKLARKDIKLIEADEWYYELAADEGARHGPYHCPIEAAVAAVDHLDKYPLGTLVFCGSRKCKRCWCCQHDRPEWDLLRDRVSKPVAIVYKDGWYYRIGGITQPLHGAFSSEPLAVLAAIVHALSEPAVAFQHVAKSY